MKSVTRETKETKVRVALEDAVRIDTGLKFFDHMLTAFGTYAGLPLVIEARGDLRHHLMDQKLLHYLDFHPALYRNQA